MNRRTFLRDSAALCLVGTGSAALANNTGDTPLFLSCGADRGGSFLAAGFQRDGRVAFTVPLPGRGHDIAQRPHSTEAVIVARRPGDTISILNITAQKLTGQIQTPANRHLYGHGAFSPDGARFFTTENDFESGRGVIGVYDAQAGYRRLGEYASGGVGPHQISVSLDGRTITVANGGIRTHPDTGRSKLNIETMNPNVAFLDTGSGRLLQTLPLGDDLRQLSIRHFDTNAAGRCAIGMQFEGDRRRRVPLVAMTDRVQGIKFLKAPPSVLHGMAQYVGGIRFDVSGSYVAASCPRGNLVVVWDAFTGGFVHAFTAKDASGLTATGQRGEFLATGGDGALYTIDAIRQTTETTKGRNVDRRWDNHASMVVTS